MVIASLKGPSLTERPAPGRALGVNMPLAIHSQHAKCEGGGPHPGDRDGKS